MPVTPPRRPNPKNPISLHTVDRRIHPQPGVLYRVLEPGWTKLWGHNLEWKDAKALKTSIANKRLSSTVMTEAEDLPIPDRFKDAAKAAFEKFMADVPVTPVAPPAPPMVAPTAPAFPANRPSPQLIAIQGSALAAAGDAAKEAQARHEAALRRAQYKKEQEDAQKETERLAQEADADELAGGADVGEAELHDFLASTGGMPTDAEIKEAKQKAAKAAAAAAANKPQQ